MSPTLHGGNGADVGPDTVTCKTAGVSSISLGKSQIVNDVSPEEKVKTSLYVPYSNTAGSAANQVLAPHVASTIHCPSILTVSSPSTDHTTVSGSIYTSH